MVSLGIDRYLDHRMDASRTETAGLLTNPSGIDSDLETTIDRLYHCDSLELEILFGPRHGIRGAEQTGRIVEERTDEKTGLRVVDVAENGEPSFAERIASLDVLIYDIQDVGCRFYTFSQTLERALSAAADTNTRVVVLDRPNPIAPIDPAGVVANGAENFPIVHGMTIGELARYFNQERNIGADLAVFELDGWSRDSWFDDGELPWVPPSPNMPHPKTALVYPGTCLFEGTTLSEGRGTTKPFELVGAPWINGNDWAALLNEMDPPGVKFRPAYFTPLFSKHERSDVEGVQVHVLDRQNLNPVAVGVSMLITAFYEYPECEWIETNGGYVVDRLLGSPRLRETVSEARNGRNIRLLTDRILDRWNDGISEFLPKREKYLMYE